MRIRWLGLICFVLVACLSLSSDALDMVGGQSGVATQSGGNLIIQDETIPLPAQPALNFLGGGVTCVNNAGASRTDCTITGATAGDAVADGITKGVATFTAADFNSTAGLISLDYTNAQTANTTTKGFLSAADWNTFNTKVSATLTVNTTAPLAGGGDLSTNRTLSIANAAADGTTKGAASFAPNDFDATAGNITLDYTNGQAASISTKGFLTSTDWNTFNSKVGTTRSILTTSPLTGGGDLSADRTLSIANAGADGATKGAASFAANDFDATAGNITLDYTNGQAASTSTKGFLTATDWNTFNTKAPSTASYLTATGEAGLSNEVNLGILSTGYIKCTVAAGVCTPSSVAQINLASEVTGVLPFANLTNATAANRLLGRGSAAGAGPWQEVTLGTGLSLSGTVLNATTATPMTIQEVDGAPAGTPSILKFSNGTVTNNGDGSFTVVTGGGSPGGYTTIQEESASLAQQNTLNFLGAGVTCVNNAGGSKTDCTIPGTTASITSVGTCSTGDCFGDTTPSARLTFSEIAKPGAPPANTTTVYMDNVSNIFTALNDLGVVSHTVRSLTPVAGLFVTGLDDSGILSTGTPTKADVGLSLVDNTSDATKNAAVATLTNKALVPRVVQLVITSNTVTPNADTTDVAYSYALAAGTTINAPTATNPNPRDQQTLEIIFKTVLPQPLTWNAAYSAACGLPLPSATTGDGATYDHFLFVYHTDNTSWCLIATTRAPSQRVTTLASSTTYTCPNNLSDRCEMAMTGATGTITVAAPTGTPQNGDMLLLAFLCSNTQSLAWNSIFIPSPNVSLPSSCPANTTQWTVAGVQYSTVLSKWQLLATN